MTYFRFALSALACLALSAAGEQSPPQPAVNPVAFVNPFIGTGGHGHTYPGATAPFGMVQLSPDTRPTTLDWDGCSGYHYSDSLIYGFSHTHLSGTGVPDYCDVLVMPYTGASELEKERYASPFQKSKEQAEAGYYSVWLDKNNIRAELTATEHVGVHRYTYPENQERMRLLFDLRHRDIVLESAMTVVSDREIVGSRISKGWAENQHIYFVARFSKPFFAGKVLDMTANTRLSQRAVKGKAIVGLLDFQQDGEPLVVTVGISAVDIEGARRNLLAECPDFDFDRVRESTRDRWIAQLSKVSVEGGSESQMRAFYTALYHTMSAPNIFSDVDGRYRGRNGEIHRAEGHKQYTVFSLWDTYRACHPLYTLLEPARTRDFIHTFLRHYEQGGRLPVWELAGNETDCMIGNHSIPVIADAWIKNIRGYDGELALKAMVHTVSADRLGLNHYRTLGYIPSDLESESVSKTLEYAFDDWSIAQMARNMLNMEVHDAFIRRAQYYKNVYDPATGFFRAKNNAAWHDPFDPFEVNFNYTEANAWQYAFAAPQDVSGLMALHGGTAGFAAFLDRLFTAESVTTGRQQADITGLIGQYVQGNEPSHHIAYLYNYAGQPWKTQERVRQIMDNLYSDQPDGLSGNEDCGQMSAWLVLSAMGFYQAVPVGLQYVIGTPWFEECTLFLENDKRFTVRAPGVSAKKKYIKSAKLNGKPLTQSYLYHYQIVNGGELELEMSDKPSDWGAAEADRPSSMIKESLIVPAPFVHKGKRVFQDSQYVELGCIDTTARIDFAFANAEGQALVWQRYEAPIRVDTNTQLVFKAMAERGESMAQTAVFSKLRTDIRVLRYNTQYDPQYTGRGESGPVDQIPGGADFRSGGWQGYQGVDADLVLDLGKPQTLRSIAANFMQDENSWIFYPTRVEFEISDDGQIFEPLGVVANTIPFDEKGALQREFTWKGESRPARYLRVVGRSLGVCPPEHKGAGYPSWLFLDEIRVE